MLAGGRWHLAGAHHPPGATSPRRAIPTPLLSPIRHHRFMEALPAVVRADRADDSEVLDNVLRRARIESISRYQKKTVNR